MTEFLTSAPALLASSSNFRSWFWSARCHVSMTFTDVWCASRRASPNGKLNPTLSRAHARIVESASHFGCGEAAYRAACTLVGIDRAFSWSQGVKDRGVLSKVLSLSHNTVRGEDVGEAQGKGNTYWIYDRLSSFVFPVTEAISRGKHFTRYCPLLLMLTNAQSLSLEIYDRTYRLLLIDRTLPQEITWRHLRYRHNLPRGSVPLLSDSNGNRIEWGECMGMKGRKHLHCEEEILWTL